MIKRRSFMRASLASGVIALAAATGSLISFPAQAAKPLKIGFSMALSGGLAGAGKAALIAMEIWKDDINKKGGLLGRPVQFVYYDDATNPSTVPGIYTKLLDVDKVDLVVSSYGTNEISPAMPVLKHILYNIEAILSMLQQKAFLNLPRKFFKLEYLPYITLIMIFQIVTVVQTLDCSAEGRKFK